MALQVTIGITFFVVQVVTPTAAILRGKEFQYVPAPTSGPTRLSTGWTDRSMLSCVSTCLSRFPIDCRSVMYNKDAQFCTPGYWIDPAQPIPSAAEGELYTQELCNADEGFYQYSANNVTSCLHFNNATTFNYEEAKSYCASLSANIFTFRSVDELSVLGQVPLPVSLVYVWVGLDDLATEGTFRWVDNGEQIDDSLKTAVFWPGEPNDWDLKEDCVRVEAIPLMLNDIPCAIKENLICQRYLADFLIICDTPPRNEDKLNVYAQKGFVFNLKLSIASCP